MAAVAAPLTGDAKYEETESLLQEVVHLFSDKVDVMAVREAGKMMLDLHATQEMRHQEILDDIKALTGQLQRAKQEHAENKSTLLDDTQKTQLLAERSRVDENIRRLVLVRRPRRAHANASTRVRNGTIKANHASLTCLPPARMCACAGNRRAAAERCGVRQAGRGALGA